jgi:glyoxylase I family protein
MKDHLNVHPRSKIEKIVMLELKDKSRIELFQYQAPDQNKSYPRNQDVGGHHLAFEVENIEETIKYLESKNVQVLGPYSYNDPTWENVNGAFSGIKWVYFQTPWGLSLELIEK